MPENKKHHYVPRFYLKRFSKDKKSICLYNLPKQLLVANANLKNQCYQDYFYGKDQTAEGALAALEEEISRLFDKIDKYCSLPPPLSQDQEIMIVSILSQYGRTKYIADTINEMNNKLIRHTFKKKIESEITGLNLDDYFVGIENVSQHTLRWTIQNYPLLIDLSYKLLLNKTKVEFITSDNPVAMCNHLLSFRRVVSNTGFSCKGLQIFFPLSPDKLIIMYDHDVYRVGGENKVIEVTNEQDVFDLNALQACSCYENIYFMSNNQNVAALHRKVKPFLRKEKTGMKVFPGYKEGNRRSEYIINYQQDIRFNLGLSFLTLSTSAKKWRSSFQKLRRQPGVIFRNEQLHDDAKEFVEKFKKGEYEFGEFIRFLEDKYGIAKKSINV